MLRSVQVVKSFVVSVWGNICQKCSQVKQLVLNKLDQVASLLFTTLEQDIEKLYDLYFGVLVLIGTLVFSLTFSGEIVEPICGIVFSVFLLSLIKKTESKSILNNKFATSNVIKWFAAMIIATFVLITFVIVGVDIGCNTFWDCAFKIYTIATAEHCLVVVLGLIALFVKGTWLNHFIAYFTFLLQTVLTTDPIEKVVAIMYVIIFSFYFLGKFAFTKGQVLNDIKIDIQQNNPRVSSLLSKIKQFFVNLYQQITTSVTRGWRQIIS